MAPPQTSVVVLRRACAGKRPGRHSDPRRGPGAVARGRRHGDTGAPLGPCVVDASAGGGVSADHRRGRVSEGAPALRRRRRAELSMQRRARVPDRSRHRERRDALEPLAVAGWGDASRNVVHGTSRRHSPGAERSHGPPPQSVRRASRRCRRSRARVARHDRDMAGGAPRRRGRARRLGHVRGERAALARRGPRDTLSPGPRRVLENRRRSPLAYGTRRAHPGQVRAARRGRGQDERRRRDACRRDGSPDDPARDRSPSPSRWSA